MTVPLLPLYRCGAFTDTHNEHDRRRLAFLEQSTQFRTAESESLAPIVTATPEQARRDLAALRLYDLDQGEHAWITAAGLPIYLAVFGRDTLTAAWQAGMVSTDLMRGTLPELARRQGTAVDDWRDEQPGKMLHQADTGPLATLGFNPLARYYGSITTSGFYPVVVSELWHWTGDKELVRSFIEPAPKALQWLDTYAVALGRGFYTYQTRGRRGPVIRRGRIQATPSSMPTARTWNLRSPRAKSRALFTSRNCTFPKCCGGSTRRRRRSGCITKPRN